MRHYLADSVAYNFFYYVRVELLIQWIKGYNEITILNWKMKF